MPGDIDPNSIPPTDALTDGVPRSMLVWLGEEAAARRDQALRLRTPQPPPPALVMWVRPAAGRVIYDINDVPYPPGGMPVAVTDTYAHRRLRDGSLQLMETPSAMGTLAAEESGRDDFAAEIGIAAIQLNERTTP